MPIFSLTIEGGYHTENGPSAPFRALGTGPSGETITSVPWLVEAQNVIYHLDGWPRKMPGASNVNGTATGASDHVTGLFDYWRLNTATTPTQQRIIVSGTQIYRESGGTLTSITSGLEAAMMPWFETMNDALVIATSSNTDVPMVYDQTTFANLGGTPPNFAFHAEHRDYMFAAGVLSAKYRLYYSNQGAHDDWTGGDAGSIDLPGQIVGLRSHKGELLIFLGPNDPRIYRLSGTSAANWALAPFVIGIGATNQQSIILGPGGDPWFWDDGGIHSLAATAAYGDYAPEFLSSQISTYFTDLLNHNRFDRVWGVNFTGAGMALWACSRAGATTNDLILALDYRFNPIRFALWPAFSVASLAMMRDASRQTIPWAGTYTGRAMRMWRAARSIAGTAYTARTLFPNLGFGDAFMDKTCQKGRVGFAPKGDTTFTVGWQRDGYAQQTEDVSQAGTAMLGDSSDNFVVGTDTLAGARYNHAFFDMGGSFKEIQIELTKTGADEDFEPHGLALEIEGAGMGTTGVLG